MHKELKGNPEFLRECHSVLTRQLIEGITKRIDHGTEQEKTVTMVTSNNL